MIAAALAVIGIVAFGFVVRRIEPIDWSVRAGRRVALPDAATAFQPEVTTPRRTAAQDPMRDRGPERPAKGSRLCTGAANTSVITGARLESELGYHTASEPIAFHGITNNAMG
jgi:hypothetical protein